jgi:hypothetical protein
LHYNHIWTVERIRDVGAFEVVYIEAHREADQVISLTRVDADTTTDQFVYKFGEPGDYYVNVAVEKVDSARGNNPTETYEASVKVSIPPRDSEPVTISSTDSIPGRDASTATKPGTFAERIKQEETIFLALALMVPPLVFAFASRFLLHKSKVKDESNEETDAAKQNPTKPAGNEKPASGVDPAFDATSDKYISIGEETLKNHFYIQCYYFSPLGLAIWVTIYASYFFTRDIFFFPNEGTYWQIMLLPLVLCVMWFLRTEVVYIALERDISNVQAGVITLVCIALLGLGANIIVSFNEIRDTLRILTIRLFPLVALALAASFFYAWYNRRRKDKDYLSKNSALLLTVVVLFFAIMGAIPAFVKLATPPDSDVVGALQLTPTFVSGGIASEAEPALTIESISGATATSTPDQSTPTPVPLPFTPTAILDQTLLTAVAGQFTPTAIPIQPSPTLLPDTPTAVPSPFYLEEFETDLASWIEFMTSGDMGMVRRSLELGKLVVQLLEKDDKLPWYYLIRDGYSYSNVIVEAVVINQGNNSNGVGLICRYSNIGWYEFVVSNSGDYFIYAVDNAGVMKQGYNLIADGSSNAIKSGIGALNTYTVTCQNDKLELKINDNQVRTLPEKNFKFADGLIGLSVSSPTKLPVNVEFESLRVAQPEK